jgi:hypothetical protein
LVEPTVQVFSTGYKAEELSKALFVIVGMDQEKKEENPYTP